MMNGVVNINQNSSTLFAAKRCADKAKVYEDVRMELLRLFDDMTNKGMGVMELIPISSLAEHYKAEADQEWLAKRKYEKGEL